MQTSTMDRKALRKTVFAIMNAKQYEAELYKTLLKEIDGLEQGETTAVEAEQVEQADTTVEAPVKKKSAKETTKAATTKKAAKVEEPEADETEAEAATEDMDDMFGGEEAEEDQGPTLEDVRKVVKDFATKHGKEKALKLLSKFKVTSIPDIKKADYSKVIELAKKHM